MEQFEAEKRFQAFYHARFLDDKTINGMMKLQLIQLDVQKQTIQFSMKVEKWQLNPVNILHGGMMATVLDVVMGCSAYVFSDAYFTPTITLSINYVRPIYLENKVVVKAYIDYIGSKIVQTRCIAYVEDQVVASANGSYTIYRK